MGLSNCIVTTNENGKELSSHGFAMFPIACYDEDLSRHLVPWHWHDDFEIILMTAGEAHIMVEGQCLLVKAGNAILIQSGLLHSANGGHPENAHCHSIVFHPRLIGGSIDSVFWQKLIVPISENHALRCFFFSTDIAWQADAMKQFSKAWQAILDEPEDYENMVRYLLSNAFHRIATNLPTPEKAITKRDVLIAERTKVMMQYIHDHYSEDVKLQRIADSAAISESVCLRSFRGVIGITPIQYLIQYRIEKAAELLLQSDRKVNEIAFSCGFSDLSYFTKCFREMKRCTPVEYRKAL